MYNANSYPIVDISIQHEFRDRRLAYGFCFRCNTYKYIFGSTPRRVTHVCWVDPGSFGVHRCAVQWFHPPEHDISENGLGGFESWTSRINLACYIFQSGAHCAFTPGPPDMVLISLPDPSMFCPVFYLSFTLRYPQIAKCINCRKSRCR